MSVREPIKQEPVMPIPPENSRTKPNPRDLAQPTGTMFFCQYESLMCADRKGIVTDLPKVVLFLPGHLYFLEKSDF
jgi:hypothetical protein